MTMRLFSLLALSAALSAALSGCSWLREDYVQPQVGPAPAQFAEGTGATDDRMAADWWTGFGDAQLNDLITRALQENTDLAAAVARVREADAQARIAGASLLPTLDLTSDAQRSRSGGGSGTTLSGTNGTVITSGNGTTTGGTIGTNGTASSTTIRRGANINNQFSARLQASYEVDFWGKNLAGVEAAEALADASRFDRRTVQTQIAGDVANTYFAVIALQDRVAVARANLTAAEGLLDALQKRGSVGLVSDLDIAQQENVVATQRTVLPGLALQLRQQIDALAILLGQLPEQLNVPNPAPSLDAIQALAVAPGLPSTLLARRPDVANAEAQLVAANADITQARAAFFPDVTMTGSTGYASEALNSLVSPGSFLWSIGAGLTQPIFEGGSLLGQLEYNQARRDELVATYKKAVLSAFADAEDGLAGVTQTAAQEDGQREAVRTAQEAFDLSQRQFNAGITDITTVLNTQRALFSAQDAFVQARLAHLQAVVSLVQALGGGWRSGNATAGQSD